MTTESSNTQKNDLTQGGIRKKILFFALPIFLGQVFQQLYNTIDSLIVGKFLGDQALAAVPMFTMLGFWCVLRVTYITVALHFYPQIEVVFSAYPLTWCTSCIVFLLYFFKADWMHNFERNKA